MIPKRIHYIWLGNKPLNNTSLMCLNTWKRELKDYEIILWNEENLKLDKLVESNRFLKKCVECKLWAFVSDYLRLYILYNEGGIYLDTDVEVIEEFGELLKEDFFIGLEEGGYIGTGIIGAQKNDLAVKRLMDFYEEEIWNVNYYNNPIIFKHLFDEEPEFFKHCRILPQKVFSPYFPGKSLDGVVESEDTKCIHWYNASWGMNRKGYVFLQTKHIKNPIVYTITFLKRNLGFYRHKKRLVK